MGSYRIRIKKEGYEDVLYPSKSQDASTGMAFRPIPMLHIPFGFLQRKQSRRMLHTCRIFSIGETIPSKSKIETLWLEGFIIGKDFYQPQVYQLLDQAYDDEVEDVETIQPMIPVQDGTFNCYGRDQNGHLYKRSGWRPVGYRLAGHLPFLRPKVPSSWTLFSTDPKTLFPSLGRTVGKSSTWSRRKNLSMGTYIF